jgi:AraC-like DNA-binding protein
MRYLDHLKIDTHKIFRSLGINPAILKSPDARIPFKTYIAIEEEAARISDDPYFGLHMGEYIEPGHYSIIGYMMMNSRNLREASEKSSRYYKIIGNLISSRIRIGLKTVKIIFTVPKHAPKISRHCFESVASSMITLCRNLTGQRINPRKVGFAHEAPGSIAEYKRVFSSPVLFNQKYNYVIVDISIGNIPVLQPNPRLLEYFENYAKEFLAEIEHDSNTTCDVIKLILEHLDSKRLNIKTVAREMAVSVRTLQNRLKSEGIVFRELLEQTREQLAKKYLRENYSIEEITYMLGYA